jgi:nicotinamidase-related amidase
MKIPSFVRPTDVSELYVERAQIVSSEARAWAKANKARPASADAKKIAVFGIDVQVAFCTPGASLFVPGAVEDNGRALAFLYGNLDRITTLAFSLDTHRVFQVFHASWWVDADGNHPPPLTPVTYADVKSGKWRATRYSSESEEYVRLLEQGGKYTLTIWPYHGMLGGISHALVPAMMELSMFHAIARDTQTLFVQKGEEPLTESYSALSPEVRKIGERALGDFDERLFELLMSHDEVWVFGQAKSHCVLSTLRDLMDRIVVTDASLAKKVIILTDAMSPVPAPPIAPLPPGLDFPRLAEAGIRELASKGMQVRETSSGL